MIHRASCSERRWNIYDVFNTLAASATARGAIDNTAATKENAYELFLNGQEYLGNRNVPDKGRVCFCA